MFANIHREMEFTATRSGSHAAAVLLNSVCDATVELDANLCITNESPRLAAMLLHGPGRSLKGSNFTQILSCQDDKDKFVGCLDARAKVVDPTTSMADVIHAKVRDSANNIVETELFVVCFAGYCDQTAYFIGIREHADHPCTPEPQEVQEVKFDASTLDVVSRSSSFELGGETGSCEVGSILGEWLVESTETKQFRFELGLASAAVRSSGQSFSFESSLTMRDVRRQDMVNIPNTCYLVRCVLDVALEELEQQTAYQQTTDTGQRSFDSEAVASHDDDTVTAPKAQRMIATLKVLSVSRLRPRRQLNKTSRRTRL
eukprot:TRINITY_DN45458_c0_g1_i1.p1 TRINITY_DN45458_c0_g1~~TRINITY_DN45458_c0_g1_i1.p1  ORF type:complete len:347 (-),score=50.41 TRINITY_DN45458_c0_g1_i1:43-990(-)